MNAHLFESFVWNLKNVDWKYNSSEMDQYSINVGQL